MQSNLIADQILLIRQTLFDPDTGDAFLLAGSRFWKLLKQIIQLGVLLGLLVVSAAIWLWGVAYQGGRESRKWLLEKERTNEEFAAYVGEGLLKPLQWLWAWAEATLKKLLGLPETNTLPNGNSASIAAGSTASVSLSVPQAEKVAS